MIGRHLKSWRREKRGVVDRAQIVLDLTDCQGLGALYDHTCFLEKMSVTPLQRNVSENTQVWVAS